MNLEDAFIKLADRIIELQTTHIRQDAQIAALIRILAQMISHNTDRPPDSIAEEIRLECVTEHQRALEKIETEDPGLAALLDRRRFDQIP